MPQKPWVTPSKIHPTPSSISVLDPSHLSHLKFPVDALIKRIDEATGMENHGMPFSTNHIMGYPRSILHASNYPQSLQFSLFLMVKWCQVFPNFLAEVPASFPRIWSIKPPWDTSSSWTSSEWHQGQQNDVEIARWQVMVCDSHFWWQWFFQFLFWWKSI